VPVTDERSDWPRVSVVVAVYNAEQTLPGCVESLLQLDYPPDRVELLCVDNASTDATSSILTRYGSCLRVLAERKRGPAAARNTGLRHATGEIVAFTDADCVVDRAWLRHLIAPLSDHAVGAVGGRILSRRPCNSIEAFGQHVHDHGRAINDIRPPYAITMSWASRLDVLPVVGFFNEELLRCSDVDLSYRLVQAGYHLVYEPRAVVYHRNERTPWGLMREGYQHGYHAVKVLRLHARFIEETATRSAPVALEPWPAPLWSSLFRLGKRIGRLQGAWTPGRA
jgi:cellulose synthase/poly-beta-1,6-N-acetylglucosamine synthase-like glycosyltransferase